MINKYKTIEKSFIMLKPDVISRGLVGRIFQRFEEQGLKLVAARMLKATKEQISKHYPVNDENWAIGIGKKTTESFDNNLKLVKKAYGTDDFKKIGKIVYEAMKDYLTSGPIIIMVWQGNHAIKRIRNLVGSTVPTFAEVASIRGSYAFDSPPFAVKSGRIAFKTMIHASDSQEEAKREIEIWFGKKFKDLSNYERVDYISMY